LNIEIRARNPQDEDMKAILQVHLDFCMSSTPLEHVHALDVSKLVAPDITVFGAYLNSDLVGVGAIRFLEPGHAELKSMHTLKVARGNGVAKALVNFLTEFAGNNGVSRLSLETGTNELFEPARKLYDSLGFTNCEAFGEYKNTEDNQCMTKFLNNTQG
jgi:putative acetyltransferase